MKKMMTGSTVALMVIFLSVGFALAGNGQGGYGGGAGNGTGPIHDIYSGEPFSYTGDVSGMVPGQGLVIDIGAEDVTIYGIGPIRYWDSLGVTRPAVGEAVTVEGFAVDYNGVVRNIATTITVGTDTVELRDADGTPLWRGKR